MQLSVFPFSNGTCRTNRTGYHGIDNAIEEMDVCLLHMNFSYNPVYFY